MTDLSEPLRFKRGPAMKNRFALAPLTNCQSHPDGTLSQEEYDWLVMRAKGGFGMVMTAAAFIDQVGKGFDGQVGIHEDRCVEGLSRLAAAIKAEGSVATTQLHHAGTRAETKVTGLQPIAPSDDALTGARAMSEGEVEAMIESFIVAAERAERAGFDGVELHGAHTYLLCGFLSADANRRTDRYGGSLDNRARPIRAIIDGIRARCGEDFNLGLRLSVESMGMRMGEIRTLCQQLMHEDQLDYLDLSLWDVFKDPEEEPFKGRPLVDWFTELDRGSTRLGVAGHVRSAASAQACLDAGTDFPIIGRAAIAHHDFPLRASQSPAYEMPPLPLGRDHLTSEGVSPLFLDYLAGSFPGFVAPT
jgi:2,4-dienoyl-CoA reductase-like NADH-dependent reductase (Old Yellow Enzyme family)